MRRRSFVVSRVPMNRLAAGVLMMLVSAACFSSSGKSQFVTEHGDCVIPPELIGRWKASAASQLGPATTTMTLGCQCHYTMRISLLYARFHEEGEYRVEDGHLVLSRETTETKWPFTFEGGKLLVTEGHDDIREYQQVEKLVCTP